ncbi:NADPH-dependent FMN reductase [Leucothrix mucor]|uniref:NADPH-dependent FMN reductase n=1 Tax=Leucothrix mucor TaxID=45248 RepID=UPI0003B55F32|nr:NAD(P)H-dependent oxidoreductase [Leucothrix mucor]
MTINTPKLFAYAASNSRNSINKQLVTHAASMLTGYSTEIADLNDYELPLFSEDAEKELGQPESAMRFFNKIGEADALLISLAEHNGNYTVAYKNLLDWCSRINPKVYQGKPLVLLATSPGPRGGQSLLEIAANTVSFFDANLCGTYSIPSFYEHFKDGSFITPQANEDLAEVVSELNPERLGL